MTADVVRTAGIDTGRSNGPRLLLADHHGEIDAACRALLVATYQDDPRALIEQYRRFERATLDHLAAEDELILPAYAEHDPADAGAIRDEHFAIRQLLYRVALDVELHVVRAEGLKRVIDTLRAHAAREDASMYPWAQVHLPLSVKRKLFVRIGRSLRMLGRSRVPVQ